MMESVITTKPIHPGNPLVAGINRVLTLLDDLKATARRFYYAVILSPYSCSQCGGRLQMIGPSQCRCVCGHTLDPTIQFQRSLCCGAPLKRRVLHYICSSCGKIIPSKFLFDERLFDPDYFREKMRESRIKKQEKRNLFKALLADSRSGPLFLTNLPDLESIPGLLGELESFVGSMESLNLQDFTGRELFRMDDYRQALLDGIPAGCLIRFSVIPPICENRRLDRVRKFITLVFMDQAHEIELTQLENDLMVERFDETDREG